MRELEIGETEHDLPLVEARSAWNSSGLMLREGQSYRIDVDDVKDWSDAKIASDPERGHLDKVWYLERPPLKWLRRHREANWYTLTGSIGKRSNTFFAIGRGTTYTANATGELFTFANDARLFYWNNRGTLRIAVTRLS